MKRWLLVLMLASCMAYAQRERTPALRAPAGATKPVRDTCANYWTLVPTKDGMRQLLVLPAQQPGKWSEPNIQGLEPAAWQKLQLDEDGYLWLSEANRSLRFDPRNPAAGATETTMPKELFSPLGSWQIVAQMPVTNHDLTAAVVGDKFYVAGGLTAEWGFPARSRAFDELWELDTRNWQWRTAAKLARARIYCATVGFDNQVWIIGGDVIKPNGDRYAVTTLEIYDPRTGKLTRGVDSTIARPMPLALAANGRLYVMGNRKGEYEQPGKMESIGVGETAWRREPDGPAGMGPLAGTVLDDKLYVIVPKRGLAIFDARASKWELIDSAMKPRSCQMAAYRGEIWMIGGRDIDNMRQTLIFNPHTKAFRQGTDFPLRISWGAAATVKDQLIVTGGAASRLVGERQYVYNDRTFLLRP